jgi:hypothetical protein
MLNPRIKRKILKKLNRRKMIGLSRNLMINRALLNPLLRILKLLLMTKYLSQMFRERKSLRRMTINTMRVVH